MKRIIFWLGLCLTVSFNSARASDKSYKAADRLLEIFSGASPKAYQQKVIIIKEHAFAAVYDSSHNWFVFYRPLNITELSTVALKKVNQTYKGYSIKRVVLFMDKEGEAYYYSELEKNKKHVIISIDKSGSIERMKPLYKAS